MYLLVTLPWCLSLSGPEVVKEHLFPGHLNSSMSWPKVWNCCDAHFALCLGAFPGSPTSCDTPCSEEVCRSCVSLLDTRRDEIPPQAGTY